MRCVAEEAFLSLLQMRNNAKSFGVSETARRRSAQSVFTTDQQVSGSGIARALLAGMRSLRILHCIERNSDYSFINAICANFVINYTGVTLSSPVISPLIRRVSSHIVSMSCRYAVGGHRFPNYQLVCIDRLVRCTIPLYHFVWGINITQ